jgi:hypothetical protein
VRDVVCLCQRAGCHDVAQRFKELRPVSEEEVVQCMKEEGERRMGEKAVEIDRTEGIAR